MFSLKRITSLLAIAVTLLFMAMPAMAADLSVKTNKTKAGIINVEVPYISGAVGGKEIDAAVNKAVFSYINAQMKQLLSEEEEKTFNDAHKDGSEISDMLRYNSDLVKYTDKIISTKSETGRSRASWYVRSEYEVKTSKNTFYSVVLKTKAYTGGSRDVIAWKALNFDLQDGRLLSLKELFAPEADYATRLQTLIGYQQMGRVRLIRHIKGKKLADPKPVIITGEENFYVDDHYNLGIILYSYKGSATAAEAVAEEANSGSGVTEVTAGTAEAVNTGTTAESVGGTEAAPVSGEADAPSGTANSGEVTIQVYDISLNDFADLIKL